MADCNNPRQDKLAAALRENLKRRKAASRPTPPAAAKAANPPRPGDPRETPD